MKHTIKLSFTDGNELITNINGAADEISSYYGKNNDITWGNNEPQVKRIEYLESDYLKGKSTYVYLFVDWHGNGLLQ